MAVSLPFPHQLPETSKGAIAVLGSVVVNLGGMYLAGLFLSGNATGPAVLPTEEATEVVINLEELIPRVVPVATAPEKQPEKAFLDVDASQESTQRPENARFESDRNSLAMTEKPAADPKADAVPTQDGEEKIPFMELQEHRYKEGPDGEIPRTPEVQPGLPVAAAMIPKLPGEETPETQKPDQLKEPNESENREKEPDMAKPDAKEYTGMPPQKGEPDAEKREVRPGEQGGSPETLEMASVDLAKTMSPVEDRLEVMDETELRNPGPKDSMPERNPDAPDPANPQLRAPQPELPESAPLKAQPISKSPQEAMAPLPPGAMASQPTNGRADEAAFSPEHHRNQMKGSLSNIGRTAAMDAEMTPLGQYKKLVNRAIERRWHQLRVENESFLTYGSLRIRFAVRKDGKVQGVQVMHEDANAVMTSFSLQAINSAKIPPMPEEILSLVGPDGLEATYDIIIY